jgi:predicted Zn-dependent protease with MMP-like domain
MPIRNLADPAYEPSDEDLHELMSRAFAHIPAQQERVARELREKIAQLRAAALAAEELRKVSIP